MRYGTKTRRHPGHRNTAPYLCPIRSYACHILITNSRKIPAWITVKIQCVSGPYLTVYVPYFSTRVIVIIVVEKIQIMKVVLHSDMIVVINIIQIICQVTLILKVIIVQWEALLGI